MNRFASQASNDIALEHFLSYKLCGQALYFKQTFVM